MVERIPLTAYQLADTRIGSGTFIVDGGVHATAEWVGRIRCRGHGARDRREPWDVRLYFSRPDQPTVTNLRRTAPGGGTRASLFLDERQYDWCVDLLRNEEPVSLVWDDRNPNRSYLTTGRETPGEGEDSTGSAEQAVRTYSPFEEDASSHRMINSYLLAHAALEVYGLGGQATTDNSAFLAWFTDRFDPWMTVDDGPGPAIDFVTEPGLVDWGFEAIVMSNQRFVIVTIRGTQAPWDNLGADWIVDSMFVPASASWANGASVHKGFRDVAEAVYPTLSSVVQSHMSGGKPVWLTGHSLGGSMATILGARLESSGDAPVAGITTYGAPAVGDANWRGFYESLGLHRRTWRWVNNNDFGPLILVGGSHVGELNFIDGNGAIDLDSNQSGSFAAINSNDHDMVTYKAIIRGELAASLAAQVPE